MPIRVAQIVGKMVGGGVESVVMNYYRNIDRSLVQFDFVVDEDSTLIPEEILDLGGKVVTVPPYQHPISYQRAMARVLAEGRWSIVHSHLNALSVFPLHAAMQIGIPVRIAHSHSTSGKGEFARNAMKEILKRFSNLYPNYRFACSKHAGEWLFGRNAQFEIIPNAIELSKFDFNEATRREVRERLGIGSNQFVVGHIGRFVSQKNHLFLIELFRRLAEKRANAVLVLVGTGDLEPVVRESVRAYGLADKVFFLGQCKEVHLLYQAFDVFVLPSLYEGLGLVGVEAQRAGLPCVFSTAVPSEVSLTSSTSFLPIESVEPWVQLLSDMPCGSREIDRGAFDDYEIGAAAGRLAERYRAMFFSAQEGSC